MTQPTDDQRLLLQGLNQKKLKEARLDIVLCALRWSTNMINEALSNHGILLSDEARENIHEIASISEKTQRLIRNLS